MEWSSPKSVTEVRSFLGLAGYYRKFLENFSKIARPLFELLKKGVRFQWGEKHSKSLEELKRRLTTALVLTMPDCVKAFEVYYFEVDIYYHPGKANKVADAVSRRPTISVNAIMTKVKFEKQKSSGLLQPLEIPE
ncbi:uncharacterized mitochondrial protein AtMg00860-like [Amaranthus tricolor]|uniref:uncharacterized mitochondrial protein AtMg00860-like n=1 Tax=Amaranthus tricolor TaxID=29722 RepID=UPI00258F1B27|nr:uncharacterized mitochondrial protein AtMg00860-like [Amaranthus tricolor]